ncbi:MAG: hypothetical protein KBD53_03200 [Candidatus Omnitrophica bacterium]|nr:hypothetical protein [Candidatus Omnitrophota bacterium]
MDLEHKIEQSFITYKDGQIYKAIMGDTEKLLIEKALQKSHGNQILAARVLGLNRNTLRAKIKKLSIQMEKFK